MKFRVGDEIEPIGSSVAGHGVVIDIIGDTQYSIKWRYKDKSETQNTWYIDTVCKLTRKGQRNKTLTDLLNLTF
jgi:hypothetical protein